MTAPSSNIPTNQPKAEATLAKSDDNLVWIDCEMTGLDPEKKVQCALFIRATSCSKRWMPGTKEPMAEAA
jgi:hypothetical protein